MNILIISQGYWPEIFPINIITKNIVKSGINVNVLTGYPNYPKGKIYNGFNNSQNHAIKINVTFHTMTHISTNNVQDFRS